MTPVNQAWPMKSLAELGARITSGSRGWAKFYSDHGSLFVRITNLTRQKIRLDLTSSRFVNVEPNDAEAIRTRLAPGDLLVSITADIGIIGYVDENVPSPAYINQHIARVRLDPRKADSLFVAHYLSSWVPQRSFVGATDQGAKAGMNLTSVANLVTAAPPVPEQMRIAEALSDADGVVRALEQLIAKKKTIKQGMMQQLLTGRARLPGFSQDWADLPAGDLGTFKGGSGFAPQHQGRVSGPIPFFKVSDMNNHGNELFMRRANNYITEAQRKSMGAMLMPADSIVFAKVGAAVFLERKRILAAPSCIDNNMAAYLVDKARVDVRFMHCFLSVFPLSSLVATGALPSMNGGQLRSIPILLPNALEEQRAIAAVIADSDAEIDALHTRLAKARALKTGVMQQLLTGRTRLPVEVAS